MIKLTIEVTDIAVVIGLYDRIRIYTSDSENGTYTYLAMVPLVAGTSVYTYNHITGTSDTWYRSSYYNTTTGAESSLSNAANGTAPALYNNITYPEEYEFTADEDIIIRKIRRLIGDLKGLERLYIDGTDTTDECASSAILEDNKTIELEEKGWPVYISVNSIEYTSSEDPVVNGYQYLTFSGTLNSGTINDIIDIWYYTFEFSDREIYEAYGDAMIPPLVPSDCLSQDHLMLQAAIDLLEHKLAVDAAADTAMIRDDMTVYDPSAGATALRERGRQIERLRKQLDALVKECLKSSMLGLEGVLID